MTPQDLTRWRMVVASQLLDDDARGLEEVAGRVGYGSGPAFSRALQRIVGVSPSQWRQRG